MPDSTYQQLLGTAQQGYSDALGGYQRAMSGASTTQPNMLPGLPQFQGNPSFDFSGNPATLGANYAGNFLGTMGYNNQLGQAISGGFGQTMAAQQAAQNRIQAGYTGLQNDVLGGIQGIGASQSQAIADAYAKQSGAEAQGLVSRGLGNTTVANSVQHGLMLDKQKADVALANQIAGLQAGYRTNIGMASLNFGNQANMQNTALANQQLGWMNSVNAPYPNAGVYGQLAQQYGASQQQNKLLDALSAAQRGPGTRQGLGVGAYQPAGGGFPQRNDFGGSVSAAPGGGGPGSYSQLAVDQARANQLGRPPAPGPTPDNGEAGVQDDWGGLFGTLGGVYNQNQPGYALGGAMWDTAAGAAGGGYDPYGYVDEGY